MGPQRLPALFGEVERARAPWRQGRHAARVNRPSLRSTLLARGALDQDRVHRRLVS